MNGLASEIIRSKNRIINRQFVIIIILLIMLSITFGYLVYVLNDIGTVETTTQEVQQENENGYNNYIGNDGEINNGETSNKTN